MSTQSPRINLSKAKIPTPQIDNSARCPNCGSKLMANVQVALRLASLEAVEA